MSTTTGTVCEPAAPKYAPVCFARMPDEVLSGFPLYLRNTDDRGTESFTLYAAAGTIFTADHRRRLYDAETTFLYIPAGEQKALRQRLEENVEAVATDRNLDLAARSEIIYETAYELLDDTFVSGDIATALPRLRRVAAAIVTVHLVGPPAFTHFYAAARHDACAATHAANAAVWVPALSRALGEFDLAALRAQTLGAMLYDIGMTLLPPAIRDGRGKLNTAEKKAVQEHPDAGARLLRQVPGMEPIVTIMAQQHQERLDGTGYPRGLAFDRIHHTARMIAVIDTYNALTNFRLHRKAAMPPDEALALLRREATHKFDAPVVEAWASVLREACPEIGGQETAEALAESQGISRRRHRRHAVKCHATLQRLELVKGVWTQRDTMEAVAHNLSRGGMGLLTRQKLMPGQYFRAQLRKKDGAVEDLEFMVVRGRDHSKGWFEAGARFVDLAREATLQPAAETT